MKKIFAFLPVALLSFALFGCMARLDLNEKMSEITTLYFAGENEFMDASISVGEREKEYIIDGKSGERTDFSLVCVKLYSSQNEEQVETEIIINGVAKQLILYFNPMSNIYMNDIGYALKESDSISFSYGGSVVELQVVQFQIGYKEALSISKDALKDDFKASMKNGELDGECYLKVLVSKDNKEKFWLFTFVNSVGDNINILINVQTGQILRA